MNTMETISYINNEERTMSMLCHLSALAGLIIPFGFLLGPLVVWLIKKDQYTEVDRQGKDALNFQISMIIYMLISGILVLLVIGFVLLILLGIFNLVVVILAAVKSNNGERFEYPLSLKIIS